MTKATIELEYEQIDAIICTQLKEHIEMISRDNNEPFADHEYINRLLEGFFVVYDYFAGEDAVKELQDEIGYKLPE
jgi:hypothetical protein